MDRSDVRGPRSGERAASEGDAAVEKLAAHMDREARATLVAAMTPVDLALGAVLLREGDRSDALFAVARGAVVLTIAHAGKTLTLGTVVPGGVIAELSLFEPVVAAATATATEPTQLLRLSHDALGELRVRHPKVASLLLLALIEDLAARVRHANTAMVAGTHAGDLEVEHEVEQKKKGLAATLARLFGLGGAT